MSSPAYIASRALPAFPGSSTCVTFVSGSLSLSLRSGFIDLRIYAQSKPPQRRPCDRRPRRQYLVYVHTLSAVFPRLLILLQHTQHLIVILLRTSSPILSVASPPGFPNLGNAPTIWVLSSLLAAQWVSDQFPSQSLLPSTHLVVSAAEHAVSLHPVPSSADRLVLTGTRVTVAHPYPRSPFPPTVHPSTNSTPIHHLPRMLTRHTHLPPTPLHLRPPSANHPCTSPPLPTPAPPPTTLLPVIGSFPHSTLQQPRQPLPRPTLAPASPPFLITRTCLLAAMALVYPSLPTRYSPLAVSPFLLATVLPPCLPTAVPLQAIRAHHPCPLSPTNPLPLPKTIPVTMTTLRMAVPSHLAPSPVPNLPTRALIRVGR